MASVSQHIDANAKEQIREILENIKSTLLHSDVNIPVPKSELIDVVQESQEELQKEKPNFTRVKGLLASVGTAIQVVASLQPAYTTLKKALMVIGISLP